MMNVGNNTKNFNCLKLPEEIKKFYQSNLSVLTSSSNPLQGLDRQIFLDVLLAFIEAFDLIQLLLTDKSHFSLIQDKKTVYRLIAHPKILHLQLAWKLPELKELTLEVMALYNPKFSKFATHFMALKKLTILPKSNYKKSQNKQDDFKNTKISGCFPSSLTSLTFKFEGILTCSMPENHPTKQQIENLTKQCANLKHYQGYHLPKHRSKLKTLVLCRSWYNYHQERREENLAIEQERQNFTEGMFKANPSLNQSKLEKILNKKFKRPQEALKVNPKLREITFTSIAHNDLPIIAQQFPTIQKICFLENSPDSYLRDEINRNKQTLQFLEIRVSNITFTSKKLPPLPDLKTLQLHPYNYPSPLKITKTQMEWLVKIFPNLTLLDLSSINLAKEAYPVISNWKSLKGLNLSGQRKIPHEAFDSMMTKCQLESLCLANKCEVEDQGLQHLSKQSKLTYLNIKNNPNFKIENLLTIPSSITALNFSGMNCLGTKHLEQISKRFPNVISLNIKSTLAEFQPKLSSYIRNMPKLKELGVSSNIRRKLKKTFSNLKFI